MKLCLNIGYSGAKLDIPIKRIQRAEALGYDTVWTSEAYGSDAITPLAWIGAQTRRAMMIDIPAQRDLKPPVYGLGANRAALFNHIQRILSIFCLSLPAVSPEDDPCNHQPQSNLLSNELGNLDQEQVTFKSIQFSIRVSISI